MFHILNLGLKHYYQPRSLRGLFYQHQQLNWISIHCRVAQLARMYQYHLRDLQNWPLFSHAVLNPCSKIGQHCDYSWLTWFCKSPKFFTNFKHLTFYRFHNHTVISPVLQSLASTRRFTDRLASFADGLPMGRTALVLRVSLRSQYLYHSRMSQRGAITSPWHFQPPSNHNLKTQWKAMLNHYQCLIKPVLHLRHSNRFLSSAPPPHPKTNTIDDTYSPPSALDRTAFPQNSWPAR